MIRASTFQVAGWWWDALSAGCVRTDRCSSRDLPCGRQAPGKTCLGGVSTAPHLQGIFPDAGSAAGLRSPATVSFPRVFIDSFTGESQAAWQVAVRPHLKPFTAEISDRSRKPETKYNRREGEGTGESRLLRQASANGENGFHGIINVGKIKILYLTLNPWYYLPDIFLTLWRIG